VAVPELGLPPALYRSGSKTERFAEFDDVRRFLTAKAPRSKLGSAGLSADSLAGRLRFPATGPEVVWALLRAHAELARGHGGPRDPADEGGLAWILHKGDPVMPWRVEAALDAFPASRAIIMVRDPRAVFASQRRAADDLPDGVFGRSSLAVAHEWRRSARAVARIEGSDRVARVRYEDLVADPEAAVTEVAQSLGLRRSTGGGASSLVDRLPPEERATIHGRTGGRVERDRVTAWRATLGAADRRSIEMVCRREMVALGYEPTQARSELWHGLSAVAGAGLDAAGAAIQLADRVRRRSARAATSPTADRRR
jgi:hypothetical protein